MKSLEPLMRQNFLEYASYVIVDRAIPDARDGCKPVQRRILHTLFTVDDGKFHKVANIIGEAMKLHPHGDVSIGDALVVLANKEYFIEKQGNFGNVITGHAAAASRYIECRLTPLAKETLFNKNLTSMTLSYDGRRQEPLILPAKLPVVLLLGTEGIAVGMATKILPHNLIESLEAQIACLEGKEVALYPDFIHGGAMDVSEYADGTGKVKIRAKINEAGERKVVITEIPYGTTTESLIGSIENAIQKGKVKISSINDFTTDKVEIELLLGRGTDAAEVIPQLYAYTDCEISISSNVVVIRDRHPLEMTISELIKTLTEQLREQIKAELEHELQVLRDKEHWLTLEQIFITKRVYKLIESADTAEKISAVVERGMQPFAALLVRPLVPKDTERLLDVRIRRISAFDVSRNHDDIEAIRRDISACLRRLKTLTKATIDYLQDIIKRYRKQYPRKTKITTFQAIDRKAVARQNLRLAYDTETGFFGSEVRGDDHQMTVSEYDLILAVSEHGTFRVMAAPTKVLLGKLMYLAPFEPTKGLVVTLVYRDSKKHAYAKKIHIQKFVRNKEYRIFADKAGKIELLSIDKNPGKVTFTQQATGKQRPVDGKFDLNSLDFVSVAAKGVKIASKAVTRLKKA